jgi:hypothetical protein
MIPLKQYLYELAQQPGDSYAQVHTRDILQMKERYVATASQRWQSMIDAWQQADASQGRMWQMHAANYLASTGGVRWAIDPVRMNWLVRDAADVDVSPLAALQFVLLTHDHVDHADRILWERLKDAPIMWVVPSFLRQKFVEKSGIEAHRIIEPVPDQVLQLHGLEILPFEGQHFQYVPAENDKPAVTLGVPAMGYRVRWQDRTWLFVGDTRTYDPTAFLPMRGADVLFGHVWLGRESAHMEPPPLLEVFTSFLTALQPARRVVLAHLYEISRTPQDCWSEDHVQRVRAILNDRLPGVEVVWALSGEEIPL